MYFAVVGNFPEITLAELKLIDAKDIKKVWKHLIVFDTKKEDQISSLASLVKWWKIISISEIQNYVGDKRILWMEDKNQAIKFKKQLNLKRYKEVWLLHTDMDVKKKWIELIKIWAERGIVLWYQNIKLYELADFDKPGRSMQMWMMPAKLTHTMINIALSHAENKKFKLIYDPFCGTGTTWIIANYLWYDFIGSDIKLWFALKNQEWWKNNRNFHNQIFDFFDQDISKPLDEKLFAPLLDHETLVVTEGWLWPIIKQSTTAEQVYEYQRWVKNLYLQFIQTIADFYDQHDEKRPVMVFTIPVYIWHENIIQDLITLLCEKLKWNLEVVDELYKRENQKVWRKIMILK